MTSRTNHRCDKFSKHHIQIWRHPNLIVSHSNFRTVIIGASLEGGKKKTHLNYREQRKELQSTSHANNTVNHFKRWNIFTKNKSHLELCVQKITLQMWKNEKGFSDKTHPASKRKELTEGNCKSWVSHAQKWGWSGQQKLTLWFFWSVLFHFGIFFLLVCVWFLFCFVERENTNMKLSE